DYKIVEVHRRNFIMEQPRDLRPHICLGFRICKGRCVRFCNFSSRLCVLPCIKLHYEVQTRIEQPLAKRLRHCSFGGRNVLAEVFEVLAEIENIEQLFISSRTEEVGTKSRTPAEHLPELCLRAHELEEDQVDDSGDVYPCVEHIDRDRDV